MSVNSDESDSSISNLSHSGPPRTNQSRLLTYHTLIIIAAWNDVITQRFNAAIRCPFIGLLKQSGIVFCGAIRSPNSPFEINIYP